MIRLTERRLRSAIRNILREYHVSETNPKSQSMHALRIDQLIKRICPRLKGDNLWKPAESAHGRGYMITLGELEKIIAGIIPIVKLDEDFKVKSKDQKYFTHTVAKSSFSEKIEEAIFSWLTGIKARTSFVLKNRSGQSRVLEPYSTGYRPGGKSLRAKDLKNLYVNFNHSPVNYDYYYINICNINKVDDLGNKAYESNAVGAKKMVEVLHNELNTIISDNEETKASAEKDPVYGVDQVLQGNLKSDGDDFMGADWFKDEETREKWGEHLQAEYDSMYDHEYIELENQGLDKKAAHEGAVKRARELIQDYADALFLTSASQG
tara:strand:+ start:3370 stop:4335 length:966 start_codon:yes stop_codon:yes gene_type:complete